jgi:DNA primase
MVEGMDAVVTGTGKVPVPVEVSPPCWVGRCPLPDHEDRSPSFTVYPESNSWYCYGCLRGGDVIELARYAWGYEKAEVAMAAADLLHEFSHEPVQRPASWFAKLRRQQEIRQGLNGVKARAVQRRLFRLFERYLSPIEDPNVRLSEA